MCVETEIGWTFVLQTQGPTVKVPIQDWGSLGTAAAQVKNDDVESG